MANTYVLVGGSEIEVTQDDPTDPEGTLTVTVTGQYSDGKTTRWVVNQEAAVAQTDIRDGSFYSDIVAAALTTANT